MYLSNVHLTRQLDIIPTNILGKKITIIGAGSIGSFTALALAKMGFQDITIYDFDTIESENLNCQFYRFSDIGKPKVLALKEIIKDFTGIEIEAINERYTNGAFAGIVITAVDSMKVRKLLWDNHKMLGFNTELFIDPRMSIETALCYAMKPYNSKDIESYEKTLYTDENSLQERCTNKSVMYTVLGISCHVTKIVKDYLTTDEQKYTRICQWSFKDNQQQCFSSKENLTC